MRFAAHQYRLHDIERKNIFCCLGNVTHHAGALFGVKPAEFFPIQEDGALLRFQDSIDTANQGAFTRSVCPDNSQHLT
jgi:hypothetical protein